MVLVDDFNNVDNPFSLPAVVVEKSAFAEDDDDSFFFERDEGGDLLVVVADLVGLIRPFDDVIIDVVV